MVESGGFHGKLLIAVNTMEIISNEYRQGFLGGWNADPAVAGSSLNSEKFAISAEHLVDGVDVLVPANETEFLG